MSLVVTQAGSLKLMDAMRVYLDTCAVHLFSNNVIPTNVSTVGSFVEAGYPGYVPQATPSWGVAFLNGLGKGESDHPALNFTSSGASTDVIFGYWLEGPGGILVFAERFFGSGIPFFLAGTSINLTLKFTDVSEF